MKYDAVEEKDDIEDVADKPGNITESHKSVYLIDGTT